MCRTSCCTVFLLCVCLSDGYSPACARNTSGVNVIVDQAQNVIHMHAHQLPELPDGTSTISYGQISDCNRFKGTITVGGTLSMGATDAYYTQSTQIRRSVQVFLDWLNYERGGVVINGSHYAMKFRWVDDSSSKQQVTNSTAHALRGDIINADFAFAGYSSGLTSLASQQSSADGLLMVAPCAASTSAFTHNSLTFGILGPASAWLRTSLVALSAAATNYSTSQIASTSSRSNAPLKLGFIQADALYTKSVCQNAPALASGLGLPVLGGGVATVDKKPNVDDVIAILRTQQQNGVNVVVGCTYYETGIAIITALERMDFSPVAAILTATVALPGYANLVAKGWWQGEYFLGPSPWHESNPTRGTLSNMTSAEFAMRYRNRYHDEVAYQGASSFAGCCTLVAGIEQAKSLQTSKVAAALQSIHLTELFGEIGFDANGQNNLIENLVLQYAPGGSKEHVVYPPASVTKGSLIFPMPTWAQRRCRAQGPGMTWQDSTNVTSLGIECSGNGLCDELGLCVCHSGWDGSTCNHRRTNSVEETGLPGWSVAIIVTGIVLLGCVAMAVLCRYKNRHISRQSKVIQGMEKELQDLKESAVGMRSVIRDYTPGEKLDTSISMIDSATGTSGDRAIWYWAEDPARMSSHNINLTLQPNWVQYAGSVAAEIEQQYQLWQSGAGPATFGTDLADRISSTGTEAKAHGTQTGTKYSINLLEMKQINSASGFKRDILRKLVPIKPTSADMAKAVSSQTIRTSQTIGDTVPADLAGEVFLQLKVGSIVQLSKQRPDGWAYGNVILNETEDDVMISDLACSENVSRDAGWFPLNCTSVPTKEALSQLQRSMGGAGANVLMPPSTWDDVKDPLVAQLFTVNDGAEKKTVVDWFMTSMGPKIRVVKVERIQNVSLWQSYAVKRQTVLARENDEKSGSGTSKFERIWLFHGTTPDIVPKITQQGFNRSFCGRNATMYGKGVYFARDASYSSSERYSVPDASGTQRMFLCRAIVGEFCQGVKDGIAPGVRDAAKHLLYDTTVDNIRDPSIYVTYHDAQAYPEYLVHFKQ